MELINEQDLFVDGEFMSEDDMKNNNMKELLSSTSTVISLILSREHIP